MSLERAASPISRLPFIFSAVFYGIVFVMCVCGCFCFVLISSRVEKEGYATLESLGATKLARVDTAGGGAVNPTWTKMRQRLLGVPTG